MNKKLLKYIFIFFVLLTIYFIMSCNKEKILSDPSARLSYTSDTVYFDSLFTELATPTYLFKIYNPNDGIVVISEISIGNKNNSFFQLNVSGRSGNVIQNTKLHPNDSLFVFVKAKLGKNNIDSIVPQSETIKIMYNLNTDIVNIIAYGQDAQMITNNEIGTEHWSSSIPYLIRDSLVIKEGHTLTIDEGVRIYLYKNANIVVRGTLIINGTIEKPVQIASNRLDYSNRFIPGQWGSIIFEPTSKENIINYADIRQATNGIYIKNSVSENVNLELHNSKIISIANIGLVAFGANVNCSNTIFANCERNTFFLTGGYYNFNHITIAKNKSYLGYYRDVIELSNKLSNNDKSDLYFRCFNSIIQTGNISEISFSEFSENESLDAHFDYCMFLNNSTDLEDKNLKYFGDSIFYYSKNSGQNLFVEIPIDNFKLDTLSVAINKGNLNIARTIPYDLAGKSRIDDNKPDLGAYEYKYEIAE